MEKKLLLMLVCVVCMVSASAQKKLTSTVQTSSSQEIKKEMFHADFSKIKKIATPIVSERGYKTELSKTPQAGLSYAKPAGTYHGSFSKGQNGITGYYPFIHGKAFYDWKFVASGGSNYTWSVGTTPLNTDESGNGIYNFPCGQWLLPTVTSGAQSYIWNEAVGAQFAAISDDLYYLSMVDMWKGSDSGGFSNVGFFSDYGYGTGSADDGSPFIACLQIYDAPQAPIYLESVNAAIFSMQNNNPLPADNFLACTIYPVNADGEIDWEYPIGGESICYREDLEDWGQFLNDGTKMFNAPFYFYELDPETGLKSPKNFAISTAYAIVIEWTSGANFGFFWGDSDGDGSGSAVIAENEKGYSYGYSGENGSRMPIDLYINIKGSMTTLSLDDRITNIVFPVGGGDLAVTYEGVGTYINVILNSTFTSDLVLIDEAELPDWVSIGEIGGLYDDDNNFQYGFSFTLTATPLPNGVSGRTARVKVKSLGVELVLPITQGEAQTSISTPNPEIVRTVRQGDDFVLSYPSAATSVSVYNVAGQRMGEYKLDAKGKYTLPAADLVKGIYILKFNGTNNTVKIVK
ncbi:MAG: T9SS type A sorting domain-containing protein [Bacteroidales bacterium]|jgi:hypothetical protein|nr:T9SS type A sorting domain-containing protein [Bacteroidales bacterium]